MKLVPTKEPRRKMFPVRSSMYLIQVFQDGHPVLWQPLCKERSYRWAHFEYLLKATEYFL